MRLKNFLRRNIEASLDRRAIDQIKGWRESGDYCCIAIKSDYNYCWRIEVTKHFAEPHEPTWVVDGHDCLYEAVETMEKLLTNTVSGKLTVVKGEEAERIKKQGQKAWVWDTEKMSWVEVKR